MRACVRLLTPPTNMLYAKHTARHNTTPHHTIRHKSPPTPHRRAPPRRTYVPRRDDEDVAAGHLVGAILPLGEHEAVRLPVPAAASECVEGCMGRWDGVWESVCGGMGGWDGVWGWVRRPTRTRIAQTNESTRVDCGRYAQKVHGHKTCTRKHIHDVHARAYPPTPTPAHSHTQSNTSSTHDTNTQTPAQAPTPTHAQPNKRIKHARTQRTHARTSSPAAGWPGRGRRVFPPAGRGRPGTPGRGA